MNTPNGPNTETGPSAAPANGPTEDNHLHVNPYPNTPAPGQPNECEAGNEPYLSGRTVVGNLPGTQSATTDTITPVGSTQATGARHERHPSG